ncbi:MAG: beta-ketoacyl-ACP synthase [Opitutaceae bacterium]|jgi:3-oxoacyl-[acyl-carrier-protein] synthase-1|nr:beta-ketoacyl-ACP synthase [Opitutaceae bacterium]
MPANPTAPAPAAPVPVFINALGTLSAAGRTPAEILSVLRANKSPGMLPCVAGLLNDGAVAAAAATTVSGQIIGPLPPLPPTFARRHESRTNRLLHAALIAILPQVEEALARHGRGRLAIIIGTCTSGIRESETAFRQLHQHGALPDTFDPRKQELGHPAKFLALRLGVTGPAYTISTACSSSARALISARRLIRSGLADAVLAGGADHPGATSYNGFHSLGALSRAHCRPFARDRDGINLGEGAALFLLTRQPAPVALLGAGETSDAYHASAPHPDGLGTETSMRMALADAGIAPADAQRKTGYINLHGTGTPLNDHTESHAVYRIFGDAVPCSSTKHLTGHTLGACGAIEASLCHALLTAPPAPSPVNLPRQQLAPEDKDPALAPIHLVTGEETLRTPLILSNSLGFGGNNATLILGPA